MSRNRDDDRSWLQSNLDTNPFDRNDITVQFWGVYKGLRSYQGIVGNTVTIPEVDVSILERQYKSPEPQESAFGSAVPRHHTISYDDVPTYADAATAEGAVVGAVHAWSAANGNMDFVIVESDADVNIQWARYMPGPALGWHSALVANDGARQMHSITIRLGIDDCHSVYQPFTRETLQYAIAHELGHYLGLRHTDDENHLMYSGELFNVDSAQVYDNRNLGIPRMDRSEVMTLAGMKNPVRDRLYSGKILSSCQCSAKN